MLTEKSSNLVPRPALPSITYQLVVPPPGDGLEDWKDGVWRHLPLLHPDVYDVEQCSVSDYLVSSYVPPAPQPRAVCSPRARISLVLAAVRSLEPLT
jgi:hypothetical protein